MARSDVRRTVQSVKKAAERVIMRIGFEVHSQLVPATPIKTGWARANWVVSIGGPKTTVSGTPETVGVARGEQSASVARLLVYRTDQGDIWISNNVPYIQALNEGRSPQADAGFVEKAIDSAIRKIAR